MNAGGQGVGLRPTRLGIRPTKQRTDRNVRHQVANSQIEDGSVLWTLQETRVVIDLAFKFRPPGFKGLERHSVATK
jgi:hypothetical protein